MNRFGFSGARRTSRASILGTIPLGNPYAYFPLLDLDTLDLQSTYPVVAPTAPNITGGIHNVDSLATLQTACSTTGRIINFTGGFDPGSNPFSGLTFQDFEFVVNPGITIPRFNCLASGGGHRIMFRGTSTSSFSGGLLSLIKFGGGAWDDVVVAGIAMSAPDSSNQMLQVYNGLTRMAVVNNQGMSGFQGFLLESDASPSIGSVVIAGNSFSAGLGSGGATGGKWLARISNDGPIVHFRNQLMNTYYSNLRTHPVNNVGPVYTIENVIINLIESQMWAVDAAQGGGAIGTCPLAQFKRNRVYGNAGSLNINTRSAGGNTVTRSEAIDNIINMTGASDSSIDFSAAITAIKTGNVYNATTTAPSWTAFAGIGAGDPTAINWNV